MLCASSNTGEFFCRFTVTVKLPGNNRVMVLGLGLGLGWHNRVRVQVGLQVQVGCPYRLLIEYTQL